MRSQPSETQSMLSFRLTSQLQAVISVNELIGLTTIQTNCIAPIPDTPPATMGIYNYRSHPVWIIDLPCLLDLTPLYLANTRQVCSIIFLRAQQQTIGFAVHQLGQMVTFKEGQLQKDYQNPGVQRLNWCINGIYTDNNVTMLSLQSSKMFDLLKNNEMTV
ncbi:chemotaxis protein CheW [Leptothoe kymatousa]|uniref:Chemotaxis protein CheW n=1 Tax=Leptothoe kymatousa TAU-MAC 1615 TaxID=2364775 RepID=A0ABS5Y0D0_9CYAN|nr:chemotaxis protein CheW [Leptothoe kymatousa]MBT9310948.1 chemotaxis protein CheW [Leptothoe kymatousa TAU-MAC 1615]